QVIDFSSNGPQFLGMVKPDVVAPGFVGYNPNPSLQYALGGDSFAGWTGTSLACPIAAGVAAIIWEALGGGANPELVAQILLSSATDTGLDAFVQGNGLVNAGAALDAIGNGTGPNDVYFSNSDSFDAYSGLMTPAWNQGYHPLVNDSGWGGNPIYLDDLTAPPTGRGLTSLYFGQVAPLDVVTLDVTAYDYGGTATADAGFTPSAWFYEFDAEYTFVVETFKYNETQPLDDWALWDGVFNLTDEMGDAAWTAFQLADYATVSASFDAAAGIDRLRFFDWNDTLEDGIFNHYNSTAPQNDYIKFVGQSMSGMNNMYVRLADPATLGNMFDYSLGLYIRDADATLTSGNEVNITVTLWKETADSQVTLTSPGDNGLNVTLTVAAGAEPGIHQGFLELDRGTYNHRLPYSYNVEFSFNGTSGEEVTVIDGWGTDHEPFDNGVVMPNADPGWRVIPINILNSSHVFNKTTLVVRVSWENPGTVVDFRLTTNEDSRLAAFETDGAMLPTKNTYIWDAGEDTTGSYYLMIQATSWDGNKAYENITVTLQAYDGVTDATYDPTWTALDSTTPAAFADAAEIEGDHINITSVWDLPAVAGLPEYAITSSEISLLSGLYVVRTGTCANPGGLDTWPISIALTDNYVWETIDGINAGESVYVHLDVGHSDASFDAYMWDDANEDDVVDADELGGVLISVDDGGSDAAEEGTFVAPSTGTVAIRVFVWAWAFTPGDTYTLTVDTRVSLDVPNVEGVAGTTWYDTYDLDRNAMMGLVFTGYTDTNVVFSDEFDGVLFTNFFAPVLSNVAVAGDGAVKTITWDAADRNSLEVLTYEVLMSDDEGETWQLLSAGTTTTGYTWDSTGFYIDEYTVQIRVADETGLTDTLDSTLFDAGTLERPPPTTPPPTTPPPVVDPNFVLWIGLIGGIGVGVVVILILFLVKKR
ncbi:MAG: S8 family serine peptidase, partial [Candidatus Thorarchaeota archaeon]